MNADKVNPNGGAIALGHPIGATGCILTIKAMYELQRTGGRYALVTMCIGGGQGIAAIFERICRRRRRSRHRASRRSRFRAGRRRVPVRQGARRQLHEFVLARSFLRRAVGHHARDRPEISARRCVV